MNHPTGQRPAPPQPHRPISVNAVLRSRLAACQRGLCASSGPDQTDALRIGVQSVGVEPHPAYCRCYVRAGGGVLEAWGHPKVDGDYELPGARQCRGVERARCSNSQRSRRSWTIWT